MILTPKERFLADATLSKWHIDTVTTPQFTAALDAALLEYGAQCSREKVPADGGLLIRGAHEFANLFCRLSTPVNRPVTRDRDNL